MNWFTDHPSYSILYYYAYLADNIAHEMDSTWDLTVATGCVSATAAGRCNLNEFLEYIWKPMTGKEIEADRPKVNIIFDKDPKWEDSKNWEDFSISQQYNALGRFEYTTAAGATNAKISGNSDAEKLLRSGDTYYTALQDVGRSIAKLGEIADANSITDEKHPIRKIITGGRNGAQLVQSLRWQEFDGFRRRWLSRNPIYAPHIQTVPLPDTFGLQPNVRVLDMALTVNEIAAQTGQAVATVHGNMLADFVTYRTTAGKPAEHWAALSSATTAMTNCKCENVPDIE
jgi:hypothetical protein